MLIESAQVKSSTKELRAHGATYGRISMISQHWSQTNNVESWIFLATNSPNWSHYGHRSRLQVLWKTLIADRYGQQCPAPDEMQTCFIDFLAVLLAEELNRAVENGSNVESFWENLPAYKKLSVNEPLLSNREHVSATLIAVTQGHYTPFLAAQAESRPLDIGRARNYQQAFNQAGGRLFLSCTGHLGLAPALSQEGDVICFLKGARVPFVVRTVGEKRYKLVGEAYIHGLKRGEVTGLNLPLREIVLV